MQRLRSAVVITIASAALFVACDDTTNDDLGSDPVIPPAATGATSATGPTGSTGANGTGPTGATGTDTIPDDNDETRLEATITDSDITISPETASGDVVLHVMNNSTTDRDLIVVRMGVDDDASTMFGLLEDDEAVDRASLDIVEEATVDADSETEIASDLDAGNYVILATSVDGDGLLWVEFTVDEDMS